MSDITIKPPMMPVDQTGLSALGKAQAPAKPVPHASAPAALTVARDVAGKDGNGQKAGGQNAAGPLEKAAAAVEKYLPKALPGTELRIEKDSNTGLFVYQAINPNSGEVVSQYPTEQVLKFISFFRAKEGIAVDRQA